MYKLNIFSIIFSLLFISICFNPSVSLAKNKAAKSKEQLAKMNKGSKTKTKTKAKSKLTTKTKTKKYKKDKKALLKNKSKSKSKRHRKSNGPDLKALTTVSPGTEFAETPSNGVNSIEIKSDL